MWSHCFTFCNLAEAQSGWFHEEGLSWLSLSPASFYHHPSTAFPHRSRTMQRFVASLQGQNWWLWPWAACICWWELCWSLHHLLLTCMVPSWHSCQAEGLLCLGKAVSCVYHNNMLRCWIVFQGFPSFQRSHWMVSYIVILLRDPSALGHSTGSSKVCYSPCSHFQVSPALGTG